MRNLLQTLFLLATTTLFAQLPESIIEPSKEVDLFDNYKGSIYKLKKHKEASITDEASGTFNGELNYNIYLDIIEYVKNDNLFQIVKSPSVYANIKGDYYYYCNFKNSRGQKRQGYYVLVELSDNYSVYKKYTLKITPPDELDVDPMTGGIPPGSIKTLTSYYLEENGVILELPVGKKDLLATLSDKKNELEKYISSEKINPKKEEDLLRLVSRYNALKNSDTNPTRSLLSNTDQNN
ncbi:hypothetical protein GCM10022393_20350 [Aquimarina addita]|uniref:GLPGLI family protein n=1 Tax=Aquimarina addita TaxID=870485 RepID=A0ABP6UKZ9_9FLAO